MENENNFKETVSSLFKGMDGFVSAKAVVGDAIHVGRHHYTSTGGCILWCRRWCICR